MAEAFLAPRPWLLPSDAESAATALSTSGGGACGSCGDDGGGGEGCDSHGGFGGAADEFAHHFRLVRAQRTLSRRCPRRDSAAGARGAPKRTPGVDIQLVENARAPGPTQRA